MYRVLKMNLEGFRKFFKNDERLSMAEPLFLMGDYENFIKHKYQNTPMYKNLCLIIEKAKELKEDNKYHSFGMLLNELSLQYFEFDTIRRVEVDISPDLLEYQISLLHQFMYPAYYN